jgi:type IV secretion system protein VirB4
MYDKDDGNRIFIQGTGGNYLTVDFGEPTGMAPLKGYRKDTAYARAALNRLLRCMIMQDDRGPIPAQDDIKIERFVRAMLRLPVKERTFARGRQFLGWDDPMGAGPRLEPWCRDRERGWLFDNDEDLINFDVPAIGFNLGPILDDASYLEPTTLYLNDRVDPIADGRRLAKITDEAGKHIRTHGMAERMSNDFRTGGKKNMIGWLATQQPEDFLSTELGRGILDQCARMVFFPTPDAHRKIYCGDNVLEGGCGCTEGEYDAISSVMDPNKHEFLIKERGLNAQSAIFRFDLSPLDPSLMHVLSGDTNRIRLWNELNQKATDTFDAFAALSKDVVE